MQFRFKRKMVQVSRLWAMAKLRLARAGVTSNPDAKAKHRRRQSLPCSIFPYELLNWRRGEKQATENQVLRFQKSGCEHMDFGGERTKDSKRKGDGLCTTEYAYKCTVPAFHCQQSFLKIEPYIILFFRTFVCMVRFFFIPQYKKDENGPHAKV